ncbi:hypothetical protein ACIB24_04275 [Spongisporangium articulatum]|uniref:Restriction endonuclease type IV Mrr domain-containing protein n=1 Tax=Spongisporangium articulatum TaxID=3362603 RepID=A0ABW8AIS5_9ACTN
MLGVLVTAVVPPTPTVTLGPSLRLVIPSASTPAPSTAHGFWFQFFTSSGFGGLMAVVAASIAGVLTFVQFQHSRRKSEEDRWWDSLTWIYDRSIPRDGGLSPIPREATYSMLLALNEKVDRGNTIQGETLTSILKLFKIEDAKSEESNERPDGAPETRHPPFSDPGIARALADSLSRQLKSKGFGQNAEAIASAHKYEESVAAALGRAYAILGRRPIIGGGDLDSKPDLTVLTDEVNILVEVRYSPNRLVLTWEHLQRAVAQMTSFARLMSKADRPVASLIVSNVDIALSAKERWKGEDGLFFAIWRDQNDDRNLARILRDVSDWGKNRVHNTSS